jgi:sugar phosphate isomerase/epimerase
MARPVTLFTGQWADLKFEDLCKKAKQFGYDGLELACWGDHFEVTKALADKNYCKAKWDTLAKYGLECYAISAHLVGQGICDNIDARHKSILPEHVYGDGEPEGVRKRAAEEMKNSARACRAFVNAAPAAMKKKIRKAVVNGFTGSSIWHLLYSFPPILPGQIDAGYADFGKRFTDILDVFEKEDVYFALEVHPTEIAFDVASAARAIEAVKGHKRFGFNYDPSHFGYQGVDYIGFIREFRDRIHHVHMKDVYWSPTRTRAGVFGGHLDFGNQNRFWEFRSLGRGSIDFEAIERALNDIQYMGPLSVEWEDTNMDREFGATEACAFVKKLDFPRSDIVFDAQFDRKG